MGKTAFEAFLAGRDLQAATLARKLRALLRRSLAGAIETADRDHWGIGRGTGYRDTLFVITPQKCYVTLGFSDGASLRDPGGILGGAGKRHRHLKVRDALQLDDSHLLQLIRAAVRRPTADVRSEPAARRSRKAT
jgi:hypothetical protein